MSTTITLDGLGLYINIHSAGHGRIKAALHEYTSDRVLCSALETSGADACVGLAREVLEIYLRIWKHVEDEYDMPERFHSTRKEGVWSITASPWSVYPATRPDASKRLELEAVGKFTPEQIEHIGTSLLQFSKADREAQESGRDYEHEVAHRLIDEHFPIKDTVVRRSIDDETGSVAMGCVELDCDMGREFGYTTEQLNAFWADVEAAHARHLGGIR